ncbi:AraC family transcriptional regulator [Sphingobium subterraneum]|uniref:AraC family transcriptional regulator n=1 Tax=Sphingobium subterraneum TaxID=627688 RepID=A0A841J2D9_9SPHN|nr:AraC family transcriptional regulator [Sphingobium subterraneum]
MEYQWGNEQFVFEADGYNLQYRLLPHQLNLHGHCDEGDDVTLGKMTFLPPGGRLLVNPTEEEHSARVLVCRIEDEALTGALAKAWENLRANQPPTIDDPDACHSLHRISLEIMYPRASTALMVEGCLRMALASILRWSLSEPNFMIREVVGGSLLDTELARLESFIDEAEDIIPSAHDLAGELGISASHLRRKFRVTTGLTVHEFVMRRKVAQAQNLLLNSTLSMKSIAYRLGFSSPSTFSIAFHRMVGVSPTHFRQSANR